MKNNPIVHLVRRNLQVFFRDRMGVFFAILSPLIMFLIYRLFLSSVQVDSLKDILPGASSKSIQEFVETWVLAGILMTSTLTTSLAALAVYVDDRVSNGFRDFLITPVKQSHLIVGYMLAAFITSVTMTTLILACGLLYLASVVDVTVEIHYIIQTLGYILFSSILFSSLSTLMVTFLKSSSAFTSLSVIMGTISGFLGGIYIQQGMLSTGVNNVINALPYAQVATLLRGPLTHESLTQLTMIGDPVRNILTQEYAIGTLHVGEIALTTPRMLALLSVIALACLMCGAYRIKRKF